MKIAVERRELLGALRLAVRGSLARTVAALMVSQAANTLIGALLWVLATRLYTPAMLGQSAALTGLAAFVATVALLGFDYTLGRYLPGLTLDEQGAFVAATCLLAAGTALALSLLALPLALHSLAGPGLIAAGCLGSASLVLSMIGDAVLLAQGRPGLIVRRNLYASLARLLLVVALAQTSLAAPLTLAFVASWALAALLTIAGLRPLLANISWAELRRGFVLLRRCWAYAGLTYLATMSDVAALALLPLLVLKLQGAAQAGVFQVVWLLATLLCTLPTSCARALFVEASNGSLRPRQARSLLGLLAGATVLAILLTALWGGDLLALVGSPYRGGAAALAWFGLSLGWVAYSSVRTTQLRVAGRVGWLALCSLVHTLLLLALAVALLPRYGLGGVGLAWFCGQGLYALMVAVPPANLGREGA